MPRQSKSESDERRKRILRAAIEAFLRFGYAKTTIGDIARSAKVHRPALYTLYPGGKEELFEAALVLWIGEIIDRYRIKVSKLKTVRTKLLFCAQDWCAEGFQLTQKHPDARDAFDCKYPAVRKMYESLASFYTELLRESVEKSSLGISVEQFAELLVFSLRGIRQIPNDADGMRVVAAREIELFLAALEYRPSRQ